jgi:hypothetical protein
MQNPLIGILLTLLVLAIIGFTESRRAKKQAKKMNDEKKSN